MKKEERIFRALVILMATGLIILSLSEMAKSQTVSFSPTSVPFWGQVKHTAKASIEYKNVKLVGLYTIKPAWDKESAKQSNAPYPREASFLDQYKYSGHFIGLFYTKTLMKKEHFSVNGGIGTWNRRFPHKHGQYINFTLQFSYKINKNLSFEYIHYSNGLGLWNPVNPGLDNIGVKVHF